ncbi:hypothetical protein HJC23_005864 [Cyclotella cryptica]|uniref:Uncharacterized protein n=1 Tax=Cyclotella cryptica TaxID=29204 RepID=A0ABD3RC68_9STRA|eukprot:CCRYP_000396-RA/>CCRYP_000396-RA protein AED:0.06 eAED:0.06 QI:247/0.8/0.83/1/1/1/6/371/802
MTANLTAALNFLSLPNACPLCIVALDPRSGRPIAVNSTFESIIGPLYKFKEWDFSNAASEDVKSDVDSAGGEETNRSRFRDAISRVRSSLCEDVDACTKDAMEGSSDTTAKVRNVEMLTLGTNDAGLPVRKFFDWTIGSVQNEEGVNGDEPASAVILYGDMLKDDESSNRARDAELIDFFQNAPIAMHWLNGDGTVLWANQTELNVLGYTAEEYIGQPIMKFCPDEEELVLEIFKQLGTGNVIKDVPVRFRTKDGNIVHLLIDSNVAYKRDGSFGHTRCFIRDDTGRKIRDTRTQLLISENERASSLRMLDNFLSRTLHHVMGPLHALRGTCELISGRLQDHTSDDLHEKERNCVLLERAVDTVTLTTRMVADVSDLARFDEGATLKTTFRLVDLRDVGLQAIESIKFQDLRLKGGDDGINVSLNLIGQGGPAALRTDRAVLLRVLAHLLENSVREVSPGGKVTLQITSFVDSSGKGIVRVEVIDNGKGLPAGTCLDDGGDVKDTKNPAPCHRYVIGRRASNDPDEMEKARAEMEEGLRSLKQNGVGVGLPLSYHLVRMLGGDLRHEKLPIGTNIYFTLQSKFEKDMVIDNEDQLKTETILKSKMLPFEISFIPKQDNAHKRQRVDDFEFGNFVSSDNSMTTSGDSDTVATMPEAVAVAKCGVKAELPFSVLIVEDTDICARVLGMQLKKLKCSTQRAENGQVAIDILKTSMRGTFDMVLMDLRMPVMDGLTATKMIRDELKMIDLPILALTGERRDDIQTECEGVGFTDFYQKPLPKKTLEDLVAKYKAIRDGMIRPVQLH